MRYLAAFAGAVLSVAILIVATVANVRAADLGAPVMAAPAAVQPHPMAGCYVELSASGQFLQPDRIATGAEAPGAT